MEIENHTFSKNFLLGGASIVAATMITYPPERASLMLSTVDYDRILREKHTSPGLFRNYFHEYKIFGKSIHIKKHRTNLLHVISRVVREEGVAGIYRGYIRNITYAFPVQSLYFALYGTLKKTVKPENVISSITVGGAAGLIGHSISYSVNTMRLAVLTEQYSGLWDAYVKTYQSKGIKGLYRGFGLSATSTFISKGLYFGLYDSLLKKSELARKHFLLNFPLAWATSATAIYLSYPIDAFRNYELKKQKKVENIPKTKFGMKDLFKGSSKVPFRAITGALVLSFYFEFQKYFS